MENCTKDGSKQLAKFFYRTAGTSDDYFRQNMLEAIFDTFGYRLVTFWVANENCILIDPQYINVSKEIMDAYEREYYQYDPVSYLNLNKTQRNRTTMFIEDVVDVSAYIKNNVYYNDILKKLDIILKMAIHLKNDGQYLGGMSLLRKGGEVPFNDGDKNKMRYIGRYISKLMSEKNEFEHIMAVNEWCMDFMSFSSDGLVVIDAHKNIKYINPGAQKALDQLVDGKDAINLDRLLNMLFYQNGKLSGSDCRLICVSGDWDVHAKTKYYKNEKLYVITFIKREKAKDANLKNKIMQETRLSKREKEIVFMLIEGKTNKQIALDLFISEQTVKTHLYNIYNKYGTNGRSALIYKILHTN
jgi:DNA-binding CsgD family transcriptional regulator